MKPFPILNGSAYAQYPILRRWERHLVETVTPGRQRSTWRDAASERYRWLLTYHGLSTAEKDELEAHFAESGGSLRSFLFLDPAANLLQWSEDLTDEVWIGAAPLHVTAGAPDPFGGSRGFTIVNAGQDEMQFRQVLALECAPALCYSAWVRSVSPASCTLSIRCDMDESSNFTAVQEIWERKWVLLTPESPLSMVSFELGLPAGASLEVFGLQAEAQSSPSPYKATTSRGGVHSNARYDQDNIEFTAIGPDNYSTSVQIVSSLTE